MAGDERWRLLCLSLLLSLEFASKALFVPYYRTKFPEFYRTNNQLTRSERGCIQRIHHLSQCQGKIRPIPSQHQRLLTQESNELRRLFQQPTALFPRAPLRYPQFLINDRSIHHSKAEDGQQLA